MRFGRSIFHLAVCLALPLGASAAIAAPGEPLVVTQLPDPDPNYVPPPSELKADSGKSAKADDNETIDQAMQDFGRGIGQAALVMRQKMEAQCREAIPATATPEQHFTYEANCRYHRY